MKKIASPIISVIMPMRNAEAYIAQAVDSVLRQSFRDLELIIIDDQSTDQSRIIVESFLPNDVRIKLINGSALGIAAAKNKGLNHAIGKLVMFCDADDLFADNRIETQLSWFLQYPDIGAVCAQFALMDCNGGNIVNLDSGEDSCDITEELLSGKTRTHLCTFLVKREVINTMGGFREFFVSAEDIDFQLRLAEACKILFVPQIVYYYRLHDSSIVHTQPSTKRLFFEETARTFRHQRAKNRKDDLQAGHPPPIPVGHSLPVDARMQLQGALIGTAWRFHKDGQKLKAFKTGLSACRIKPENLMAWKSFVMLFLK